MRVLRTAGIRFAGMAVTLLVSSFLVYSAMYLAPGDPIATLTGGRPLPAEAVQSLEREYNLDQAFVPRYFTWLGGAAQGDFGESVRYRRDIGPLISARAVNSLTLVALAGLLTVLIGTALGILAAVRRGIVDNLVTALTSLGLAVPSFVAAVVLIYVFGVQLSWFPTYGAGEGFGDRLYHLALPAIALAAVNIAYVARVTREATAAELRREHVETARARGLSEAGILRRHVIRNAMIPITTVGGVTVASLIAGAVVVENAFSIDGLGSYLVDSVIAKDFAVAQAICLILVTCFILVSTLVDVLYGWLDPRVSKARTA